MSFFRYFILVIAGLLAPQGLMGQKALVSEAQILAYCKQHSDTYVVVVWPRGCKHLKYITQKLGQHGLVIYSKKLVFNKKQLFALFCKLHTNISHNSAQRYFKPYLRGYTTGSLPVVMLVFRTKASLKERTILKKMIRKHIGQGRRSIHINDHHDPETFEAADALLSPTEE